MKFKGIMPALVTPLNEDETLNADALKRLIEHLLSLGAMGFYIGGATGEGLALRREVREELAECAVKTVAHRVPCIVHIASMNFEEAKVLARHAEKIGAEAVSAVPPLYFKYEPDDIYAYYKALASVSSLPMMAYNTPAAGYLMDGAFAARLFEIDNVTAVKWTSPRYNEMMRCLSLTHGEMNVINGPDESLLMGLSAGAHGGIGTTYNLMLPTVLAIYNAFQKGELETARKAQYQLTDFIAVLQKHRFTIPAVKAALEMQGFPVGNAAFPQRRFTEKEKKEIYRDFVAAGMAE